MLQPIKSKNSPFPIGFTNQKGESFFFNETIGLQYVESVDAGKLAMAIIFRLEKPKARDAKGKAVSSKGVSLLHRRHSWQSAKIKKPLSLQEKQDVAQITFLMLARWERVKAWKEKKGGACPEKTPLIIIKKIFQLSRKELRMNHSRRDEVFSMDLSEKDFPAESNAQIESLQRLKLAQKIRKIRTAIFAAYAADKSRKRKAALQSALEFLRFLASGANPLAIYSGKFFESEVTRRKAAERFKKYVSAFLEKEKLQDLTQGLAEDMTAL